MGSESGIKGVTNCLRSSASTSCPSIPLDLILTRLVANEGVQALVLLSAGGVLGAERQRIVQFALAQRWPVIGGIGWGAVGALLSYSADTLALIRRAAHYVDRILKGRNRRICRSSNP